MLGELIANSEYYNVGELLGIEGLSDELLGQIKKMNPVQRKKVVSKLLAPPMPSAGSRAEMEKHFKELPPHIKAELFKGNLRLADAIIYSIKPVSSKTVKLFETQDVKEVGLRNISNGRLPKNQALLVSGIIMLAGSPVDATKDNVMSAEYKAIETYKALANGEFNLKANKKVIVPETANYVFKTSANQTIQAGYYKLANPRLIHDDIQIEFTIDLGTVTGLDATTHVFVGLHGTITTP